MINFTSIQTYFQAYSVIVRNNKSPVTSANDKDIPSYIDRDQKVQGLLKDSDIDPKK